MRHFPSILCIVLLTALTAFLNSQPVPWPSEPKEPPDYSGGTRLNKPVPPAQTSPDIPAFIPRPSEPKQPPDYPGGRPPLIDPDVYEPDNTSSTAQLIFPSTVNQVQSHSVHVAYDPDWYMFYGTTGNTYVFYSTGSTDVQIWLYQSDGSTLLASDDDGGVDYYNFLITFTPTVTAYYKVKVVSYGGSLGAYALNYWYHPVTLPPPANLVITRIGTTVYLNWSAVPGATYYRVDSSDNPYSGFINDGATVSTNWASYGGLPMKFFRVIAINN